MNAIAWIQLISLILQTIEAELPGILALIPQVASASAPHQAAVAATLAAAAQTPK
jgi:hypothetical protein